MEGKQINEVKVRKLAGSSDPPIGFNDFIDKNQTYGSRIGCTKLFLYLNEFIVAIIAKSLIFTYNFKVFVIFIAKLMQPNLKLQ